MTHIAKEYDDATAAVTTASLINLIGKLGVINSSAHVYSHYMTWDGESVTWLLTIEYNDERHI